MAAAILSSISGVLEAVGSSLWYRTFTRFLAKIIQTSIRKTYRLPFRYYFRLRDDIHTVKYRRSGASHGHLRSISRYLDPEQNPLTGYPSLLHVQHKPIVDFGMYSNFSLPSDLLLNMMHQRE